MAEARCVQVCGVRSHSVYMLVVWGFSVALPAARTIRTRRTSYDADADAYMQWCGDAEMRARIDVYDEAGRQCAVVVR